MTGLPSLPALPPAAPRVEPVAAAARTWVAMARAVSAAGGHTSRAVEAARAGWSGPAGDSAVEHAERIARCAAGGADAGLAGATVVAAWALRLRHLAAERSRLRSRCDAEALSLAGLALLPDARPDAPAIRAAAWRRHDDLVADGGAWLAAVRRAEDELLAGLRDSPLGSHEENLDAAYRALLALEDSPSADAVRTALAGSSDRYLLDFDPAAFDGDGSAVIAYGAPSAADHVAVVVPGMTTDAVAIGEVGSMALAVRGAAQQRAPRERTATVAWVGYDAPADDDLHRGHLDPRDLADTLRVAGPGAAEEGGRSLRGFVEETTTHDQDVTVIGHSYGSTTAAHAAADGLDADRLVLLGSPGAGVDRAAGLRVPTFVAAEDLDPVTWIGTPDGHHSGPLGPDPAGHAFGAVRLPTDPPAAPHLDQPGAFVAIHAGYLVPGSSSLAAVASVVTDCPTHSVPARTSTGAGLAADWLLGQAAYELTSWR